MSVQSVLGAPPPDSVQRPMSLQNSITQSREPPPTPPGGAVARVTPPTRVGRSESKLRSFLHKAKSLPALRRLIGTRARGDSSTNVAALTEPPKSLQSKRHAFAEPIAKGRTVIYPLRAYSNLLLAMTDKAFTNHSFPVVRHHQLQMQAKAVEVLNDLGFPVVNVHGVIPVEHEFGLLMDHIPGAVSSKASTRDLQAVLNGTSYDGLQAIERLLEKHNVHVDNLKFIFAEDGQVRISLPTGLEQRTSPSTENLQQVRRLQAMCPYYELVKESPRHRTTYYKKSRNDSTRVALSGKSEEELGLHVNAYKKLKTMGFPLVTLHGIKQIGDNYGLHMDDIPGAMSSKNPNVGSRLNSQSRQDLWMIEEKLIEEGVHVDGFKFRIAEDGCVFLAVPISIDECGHSPRANLPEVRRLIRLCRDVSPTRRGPPHLERT